MSDGGNNAIFTIDVSHHDWSRRGGNLDWARIKRDGIEVMCARATYGDPSGFSPDTRHFGDFQNGARAAGFTLRGGYHNLVRGDAASMRRQVTWFRSELDRYGCTWAMLDIERYPELVERDLWPRMADVLRFQDAWYAQTSMPLAYYLPRWIWSGHMGSPDLRVLRGPLVASDYGANLDGLPAAIYDARGGDSGRGWQAYGGVTPAIWQFGSNCDLPGASGHTDINAYRGTVAQLRALLTDGTDMDPAQEATLLKENHAIHAATFSGGSSCGRKVPFQGSTSNALVAKADYSLQLLETILAAVKGDEDTAAILARIDQRAAELRAGLAADIIAALPEDGPVDVDTVEAALRRVLGSVDGATPAQG